MQLIFVRHAQPAWAVDGVAEGNPGLTEQGRSQALLLADRLAAEAATIDEIVTSHANRNIETASYIADRLGLEPIVVPGIVEIGLPDFTGSPSEEVERWFRDEYRRPPEDWWGGHAGGETFRDFHNRVTSTVVDLLAERHITPHGGHIEGHLWDVAERPGNTVVVGHGGTNAVAIGFLLGLEPTPWEWERFVLGHASIARLGTFPLGAAHIFSMRSFNDQEHIPPVIRSR